MLLSCKKEEKSLETDKKRIEYYRMLPFMENRKIHLHICQYLQKKISKLPLKLVTAMEGERVHRR